MKSASAMWQRVPVAVRAVLIGLLVVTFGALGWSLLFIATARLTASVAWATGPSFAILGGLYLWAYWRYLGGAGWPRSTAEARRRNLRGNRLSGAVWAWALSAGALAILSYVAFLLVWERVIRLQPWAMFSNLHFSLVTALCFLLATAAEAGVVEEAAFRGYMQSPLEKRYGPVIAIVIVSAIFGAMHIANGSFELTWLFPYVIFGAVLGILAYLTNSILPGVMLHATGDAVRFLLVWKLGPNPRRPLVWESGADAAFWLKLAAVVFFGAAAVWAYGKLAAATRLESVSRSS